MSSRPVNTMVQGSQAGSQAAGSQAEEEDEKKKLEKKTPAPNAMEGVRDSSIEIDQDMVVKEWKPPTPEDIDPADLLLKEDAGPRETYGLKGSPSSQLRIEEQKRETGAKMRARMAKRLSKAKAKEEAEALKEQARARKSKGSQDSKKQSTYQQDIRSSESPSYTPSAGGASPSQRPSIQSERPSQQAPRMSTMPLGTRNSRALLGSIMGGRRMSVGEERKGAKYAPTYRMESRNPFKAWQVRKILEELMQNSCKMKRYDASSASKRAISLAGDIRTAVRALNFDRYKICVKVDVGQKWDQGCSCVSRFLWDIERDDFAFHVCENSQVYVIACVFGMYYD